MSQIKILEVLASGHDMHEMHQVSESPLCWGQPWRYVKFPESLDDYVARIVTGDITLVNSVLCPNRKGHSCIDDCDQCQYAKGEGLATCQKLS